MAIVEVGASEKQCDFCGNAGRTPIAIPVDDVVDYMEECISSLYEDPANGVGWDGADGGYQLPTMSTSALLEDVGLEFPRDEDGELLEAVCEGLGGETRQWVRKSPYSTSPEERDDWSWEDFESLVKQDRRFFFFEPRGRPENELLSPQELLAKIAELSTSYGLVRTVAVGTRIYRVRRLDPGQDAKTALELGPPPPDAIVNLATRMSPAGIPMFYGAEDARTAIAETWDRAAEYVTACFETTRDVLVLDLTRIPRAPSIFESVSDTAEGDPHLDLRFLNGFAFEVSKPIDRKNRAHVDYVPTQVVSEFFRVFPLGDGRKLDGISYSSAQRRNGVCFALYARQADIVPSVEDIERYRAMGDNFAEYAHENAWLKLVDVQRESVRRRPR